MVTQLRSWNICQIRRNLSFLTTDIDLLPLGLIIFSLAWGRAFVLGFIWIPADLTPKFPVHPKTS